MKAIRLLMTLAAMCVSGCYASAQDLIVKKDGSVIQAKVTKIGTSEVEYKKWSNQDGPQYSVAVADILAINFQNGEKETFENVSAGSSQAAKREADGQQNIVQVKLEDLSPEAKVANDALIAKYNAPVELDITEKQKKKIGNKTTFTRAIYGIWNNSLITNDDIEIGFVTGILSQEKKNDPVKWIAGNDFIGDLALLIRVRNKTNRTLYIDLGNSFFISVGQATCLYVPSSTTTTHGASSGGSLNLGAITGALGIGGAVGSLANGINVGGGSTNTTTNTTYTQRVIAVPPMSSVNLPPQYFYGKGERDVTKGLVQTENGFMFIWFPKDSEKGTMRFGDRYSYTADNSPLQFSCVIAYSTEETCLSMKSITSNLYLRELIATYCPWCASGEIKIKTEIILGNCFSTDKQYKPRNKTIGEFPRY